jgi:hypothetical protein
MVAREIADIGYQISEEKSKRWGCERFVTRSG